MPEGGDMVYLKSWKGKAHNQKYSTQQGSPSDLMDRSKVLQRSKTKRAQHRQTSFMRNLKGAVLGEKEKATTET